MKCVMDFLQGNCKQIFNITSRYLLVGCMLVTVVALSACKVAHQLRKEEAGLEQKRLAAQKTELERQTFCRNLKKLKVGMTDDEIEAAGIVVYPQGYRRSLKCDPKHPNKLLMRLQFITFQFGDECRVLEWQPHPRSKCDQ